MFDEHAPGLGWADAPAETPEPETAWNFDLGGRVGRRQATNRASEASAGALSAP